jgi:hypothetical protein
MASGVPPVSGRCAALAHIAPIVKKQAVASQDLMCPFLNRVQ